jgi:Ca2+-binding EF-hand superfamily protein
MGLCGSSKSIYTKYTHLSQWKHDFDALMVVDSDLEILYKLFQNIDKDGSGEIDLVELIHYLRLQRTKFNKRVFTIFDEDGSGEIDFREFVVALWNYCTMGKSALTIFAFDLYDLDGSGEIELEEVECMLKEVYGKAFKTSKVANQLLEKLIVTCHLDSGGALSVEKFNFFCTKHPGLLFPAFRFQIELQEKLGGKPFWARAAKTRVKLSNGANLTVQQLLMAHVSESAFNEVTRHDSKSAIDGRKNKTGISKMVEKMQSAHQNDEGRVRRGNVLDAVGLTSAKTVVLDPNRSHELLSGVGSGIDPKLKPTQFRDFAMNTGTVADRRARREIEGGTKAKLQALSAFAKAGAFKKPAIKKGGVGAGGWRKNNQSGKVRKGINQGGIGGKRGGRGGGRTSASILRSASLNSKKPMSVLKASAIAAKKKRALSQSSITPG